MKRFSLLGSGNAPVGASQRYVRLILNDITPSRAV